MDIFVNVKEGRRRFLKLGNFVVMLIAQAYFSNVYTKDIRIAMSKIKVLLKESDISTATIDLIEKVITGNLFERDIKYLMSQIIVGSREELRQVMNAVDIMLQVTCLN
ncbi:hypothetical protein [Desemzia incerta]|uniref:hypothetical protein n=1 Tax=Desemzia incerta TaxID=82801 RepID=UPI0016602A7E|nr:hypothetical protein [Desemzia incerta]